MRGEGKDLVFQLSVFTLLGCTSAVGSMQEDWLFQVGSGAVEINSMSFSAEAWYHQQGGFQSQRQQTAP